MNLPIRYIARLTVEAASALGVGSGSTGLVNDRLVVRDANGLPYIPGTSLAGVLRHELENANDFTQEDIDSLFGFQKKEVSEEEDEAVKGKGSRILFSEAVMLAEDGKTALEGLQQIDFSKEYYQKTKRLPERDHVRINHKGTAVKHGKFEEEYVHRGTRFVFEIELKGEEETQSRDTAAWNKLLELLNSPFFRIGGGTRKGFGQLEVKSGYQRIFDLAANEDLIAWLEHGSSLNATVESEAWKPLPHSVSDSKQWKQYSLNLKPESFFFFGAGYGDNEVSMLPKKEQYFSWASGKPQLKESILLPATSIKGALAHRVAYHYNKLEGTFIENTNQHLISSISEDDILKSITPAYQLEELAFSKDSTEWQKLIDEIDALSIEDSLVWQAFEQEIDQAIMDSAQDIGLPVGEENEAVKQLFGYAKDSKKHQGLRGRVIISDIYLDEVKEKIFNHVKIDRFTGGAVDGALFQEKVVHTKEELKIEIYVDEEALRDKQIKAAFEAALEDLKVGALQLGGNTAKGHGAFQEIKN
jgi:CRISPR/Cas system CSM-associated protein Csm3 (group 7 of RAMP superfamily)